MGDAAYATTSFQGQGAGQAIKDAYFLQTFLGAFQRKSEIPNALVACYEVRRPRAERIVSTSREVGYLITMRMDEVKDKLNKTKESCGNCTKFGIEISVARMTPRWKC